jgi:hypothetical protein
VYLCQRCRVGVQEYRPKNKPWTGKKIARIG